jgi:hypothetical protein
MVITKCITFLTVTKYLFRFFVGFFPFNLSDVLSTIVFRFVIVIFVFRVTGSDYPLSYIMVYALWCLTSLSIIFQLHRGGQFYW